jgi:hypothetical protein
MLQARKNDKKKTKMRKIFSFLTNKQTNLDCVENLGHSIQWAGLLLLPAAVAGQWLGVGRCNHTMIADSSSGKSVVVVRALDGDPVLRDDRVPSPLALDAPAPVDDEDQLSGLEFLFLIIQILILNKCHQILIKHPLIYHFFYFILF